MMVVQHRETMSRRDLLRWCAVAGAVSVGGRFDGGDETGFEGSFAGGSGECERGAAIGPEVELADFEWELGVSGEEAVAGDRSPDLERWKLRGRSDIGRASRFRETRHGGGPNGDDPVLQRVGVGRYAP